MAETDKVEILANLLRAQGDLQVEIIEDAPAVMWTTHALSDSGATRLSDMVTEIKRAALEGTAKWLGNGGGYLASEVNVHMDHPDNPWDVTRSNIRNLALSWSHVHTAFLADMILTLLQREDLGIFSGAEARHFLRNSTHYQTRCLLRQEKLGEYAFVHSWGSHPDYQ